MIKKRVMSSLLAAVLVFSFAGCGQEAQNTSGEAGAALVEPVIEAVSGEKAAYRNLYNYKVYSASVYPTVKEYSFAKTTEIENYGAFWGGSVEDKSVLAYGSTETIDEQIENMEERIADMDENIVKTQEKLDEGLAPDLEEEKRLIQVLGEFDQRKPPETVQAADGSGTVTNPEYSKWESERRVFEGKYRILSHDIDMRQESFRQQKELYELERAYLVEQLNDMKTSRKENVVYAKESGEVVALKLKDSAQMNAEEAVVAVGNTTEKILRTDYISKSDMAKAQEVYALINGVRYEVEYVPMSNDEYTEITAEGGKAYTTFKFAGDASAVEIGGYGVVTLFTDKKENVLSVPKSALRKDENGYFVYVMKNGDSVYTSVKIGMTDGAYTEILSGLAEGDVVMVDTVMEYSGETVQVAYGSYSTTFKNNGHMVYSESEVVNNPVEYGTTYFGEYLVVPYQHVEKGDVIATIRVKKDEITIQRNKVKLQRAQERLNELIAENNENNAETIEARQEEIAELEELIREMEADAATTEIKAPRSGMITNLGRYETETILYYESFIVEIADETSCYLELENTNQLLNYGNNVEITYNGQDGSSMFSTGVVASISAAGVSSELQSENAYILLPEESIPDMAVSNLNRENYWNRNRYQVTATVRKMDNILVVPRNAVRDIDGCAYVYVKDEQGNVKAISFVAAGYNASEYWVIEGLTEGMKLCLK